MPPQDLPRSPVPDAVVFTSIGHVRGGRGEATKDDWGGERSTIVLDAARFSPDALAGLAEFSHLMVVFYFHIAADEPVETGARHPRGRADWPRVGIFAQRGRMRPNRIGVSIASIVGIDGLTITLAGLDAVDGSPVLDLKPVFSGYAPRGELVEPAWARAIMANYW